MIGIVTYKELIEDSTASGIRERHSCELEVVDGALDPILAGLDDFAVRKGRPDSRLESARLLLSTISFNSIRAS